MQKVNQSYFTIHFSKNLLKIELENYCKTVLKTVPTNLPITLSEFTDLPASEYYSFGL